MLVEPGSTGALLVVFLSPSGKRNEQHVAMVRCRANLPRDFVSIHARHPDIEQH